MNGEKPIKIKKVKRKVKKTKIVLPETSDEETPIIPTFSDSKEVEKPKKSEDIPVIMIKKKRKKTKKKLAKSATDLGADFGADLEEKSKPIIERKKLREEFIETMDEKTKIAYKIAQEHLESSFDLDRCIEFQKFVKKHS